MAQQLLNLGTAPNDSTGDPLRVAGGKINENFSELYNQEIAGSTPLLLGGLNWDTLTHEGASQNYSATGDIGFIPPSGDMIIQTSTSVAAGEVVGYGFYPELLKGSYPGEELAGTLTVGATVYTFSLTVDKTTDVDTAAFTAVTETKISTVTASDVFTPTGQNAHCPAYVSSSTSSQVEVSLDGGSWVDITAIVTEAGAKDEDLYVNVEGTVEVRHLSSVTPGATTSTLLAIGNPAVEYQFLSAASTAWILQPSITAPLNEAIEVPTSTTVTSDAYVVNNHNETHATSDWQVSEYSDFSVVHEESLADAVNLVSWAPATLAAGAVYYVRVLYNSATHSSDWSEAVKFTTPITKVMRPDGTAPANSAVSVSTSPTLTSSAFIVSGAVQTHAQSQWQITLEDNDWNAAPVDDTSAVDLVSHATSGLAGTSVYKWRVRHEGSTTGWSAWSQPLVFKTA